MWFLSRMYTAQQALDMNLVNEVSARKTQPKHAYVVSFYCDILPLLLFHHALLLSQFDVETTHPIRNVRPRHALSPLQVVPLDKLEEETVCW